MGITLGGMGRRGVRRDPPAVDEPPEYALVGRPEELGSHECLVVETGGEERSRELVHRLDVKAQRWPGVLGCHRNAARYQPVRGTDVRFVTHLHHAPGVMEGG